MHIMPESEPPYPQELEPLSASCEVVWIILDRAEEPLTYQDICPRTACTDSSVRYALRRLRDETDLLEEHPTGDARQSAYTTQS